MNQSQKARLRLIFILVTLVAAAILAALYHTQVLDGDAYAAKADKQYSRPPAGAFDRGSIYFKAKDGAKISAATVEHGYAVFINPKLIDDPEQVYEAVSQFLQVDRNAFLKAAMKNDDPYEVVAHRANEDKANSIRSAAIVGVGVAPEAWRSYPGGAMAAHELGLTGESASSTVVGGKYGLERSYEEVLGRGAGDADENLFAQLFSDIRGAVSGGHRKGDIVMTIEPTVQSYLEKVLNDADRAWKPDEIGGVVLDPITGEVLAMASLPSFDPNDVSKTKNIKTLSNPVVESVYEMGSIMKPLTMATGLDTGAIGPDTKYNDTDCLTLDGRKICNHDLQSHGLTDMQTVLSKSLNVGAATIALKVGSSTMIAYLSKYGLDGKTGIDLPNEAAGLTGGAKTGRDIEIATAAYGQGIAISPISIARALSVLANGGYLIRPRMVSRLEYSDGTNETLSPEKTGPILSKQTTDEVTKMLVEVVDTALKGGKIKMEHYSIAAKTGTAQVPDPKNGGYYSDRYLHSFFGYFPAYDPKFLVFLYQLYPKGAAYASETLTDPFANMAKFLINYYDVPPDR